MNKYSQYTLDQLVELMKQRPTMVPSDAKELQHAYRESLSKFIEDSRSRHAAILAVLGSNYARCLSN